MTATDAELPLAEKYWDGLQEDLASVILQMKSLRLGDVQDFPFLDPPDYRMIRDGLSTLHELSAIDENNEITPLGRRMARLPIDEAADNAMAQVDPVVYQAQYDQAVAKKAQDEATLANARVDLERYVRLALTNAGPKQQADTQKALVAQLEALVK